MTIDSFLQWKFIFLYIYLAILAISILFNLSSWRDCKTPITSLLFDLLVLFLMAYITYHLETFFQSFVLFALYNITYFYALLRGAKNPEDYIKPKE